MNTRGMSPLIATVLLIAFAVILGAIVMSWGEKYIEEKAEFVNNKSEVGTGCDTADIHVVNIQGLPKVCQHDETLQLTLETEDHQVWDVHARVIGEKNTLVQESLLTAPIPQAGAANILIHTTGAGNIQQLKLTPKSREGRNVILCSKKAVIVENIRKC